MRSRRGKNILRTLDNGLCLSCGICAGVCPTGAIAMKNVKKMSQYRPFVDSARCTNCGMCQKVCPGLSSNDMIQEEKTVENYMEGNIKETYNGYSKDNRILKGAASGGVTTTIVEKLLEEGIYDYAVGVKKTIYEQRSFVELVNETTSLDQFQKSKYHMASYQLLINFIAANPTQKIIIVGVGCIINSIQRWLSIKNLDINQYFFIGLFCDRTLTNQVIEYFYNYDLFNVYYMKELEYRTKDKKSYWPGNVKLVCQDNREIIIPKEERSNVCEYFQNQRCLYCLNHLNIQADIALGDNYTLKMKNRWGSNSIIVRTDRGKYVLDRVERYLHLENIDIGEIIRSQGISKKTDNYIFSKIFENDTKIKINGNLIFQKSNMNYYMKYKRRMIKLLIGRRYYYNPKLFNLYFILLGKSKIRNRLKLWHWSNLKAIRNAGKREKTDCL